MQDFFRRHWQELLRIREKLRLSEETVHLLLAAGVGIIGGLVNLVFHLCIDTLKEVALRHQGDFVEIAEAPEPGRELRHFWNPQAPPASTTTRMIHFFMR